LENSDLDRTRKRAAYAIVGAFALTVAATLREQAGVLAASVTRIALGILIVTNLVALVVTAFKWRRWKRDAERRSQ
jgi:hypothetical protein